MSLFLANMWDELLSERGLLLLEVHYGSVRGNWLRGPRHAARPQRADVLVHSPTTLDGGLHLRDMRPISSKVITWVLFPDQVLGWDFTAHNYLYRVQPELAAAMESSHRVWVNSAFTASVLRASGVDHTLSVVPLAVDCHGIAQTAGPRRRARGAEDTTHVWWAHMWRTQKDPETALRILDAVLNQCPHARVSIGRAWSWADAEYSPPAFRRRVTAKLTAMCARHRERMSVVPRFDEAAAYWGFLGTVDVSFSCAREESFGVAMMEHAAAGAACVAPSAYAYPELHTGALLTNPTEETLTAAVCSLVNEPENRQLVATACRTHAESFDAQVVVPTLVAGICAVRS